MRKYDIGSGLVLLALGAVIAKESLALGLGTWTVPGPGFLPFGAGMLLLIFSMGILLLALLKGEGTSPRPGKFWPQADSRKMVLLVLAALILYNLLWTRIGFSLTTFLFMGFLLRVVGKRQWWVVITVAVLTSAAAYLLFQTFLKSQLPSGFIGF